ncbi:MULTISPECIES: CIA30 family protein [unclassified Synechococcus]|uniref:CIA30 family protein n=1 Tax=unclassified Synechococcus TaxID=2626047 RepID=UPI002000FC7F|nr:CIA30 family protein [Synechococcus sp. A10-1-5-1]UPM50485.1 CIA30 family protein [Synechococcus sp. A10-1-5-1]
MSAWIASMVAPLVLANGADFPGWQSLNDTIMGGRSQGQCRATADGLLMEAFVESEGGGFVSCRSPVLDPARDLSSYGAIELQLDGDGRRYKLAIACRDGVGGLTELIPGGLRWVAEFSTRPSGTTVVTIPFNRLTPSVRATPIGFPLRFDPARVTRIQVLHSKFGDVGGRNPGFRPGPLRLLIRSIRAVA